MKTRSAAMRLATPYSISDPKRECLDPMVRMRGLGKISSKLIGAVAQHCTLSSGINIEPAAVGQYLHPEERMKLIKYNVVIGLKKKLAVLCSAGKMPASLWIHHFQSTPPPPCFQETRSVANFVGVTGILQVNYVSDLEACGATVLADNLNHWRHGFILSYRCTLREQVKRRSLPIRIRKIANFVSASFEMSTDMGPYPVSLVLHMVAHEQSV